jgi:Flp pilus assembly protein TadG
MWYFSRLARRFKNDRSGNIALTAALTSPLLLGVLALGVEFWLSDRSEKTGPAVC